MSQEYITVSAAKKELGEEMFFAFHSWLRKKGYTNLTQVEDTKYRHEIFATKKQLHEFINEQIGGFRGRNLSTTHLFGQTRELLSARKRKLKRI